MIQLKSTERLSTAIKKARTVKPFVRIDTFGSYSVTNRQTGATYNVVCLKRDGQRFGHCTCKAGERGMACYHLAAAAGAHVQLAAERTTH